MAVCVGATVAMVVSWAFVYTGVWAAALRLGGAWCTCGARGGHVRLVDARAAEAELGPQVVRGAGGTEHGRAGGAGYPEKPVSSEA